MDPTLTTTPNRRTDRRRYRQVFALPSAKTLIVGTFVGQLPIGMVTLTLLLGLAHAAGSFAVAGVLMGAYVVASGVVAPALGRCTDRYGAWWVLAATASAFLVSFLFLIIAISVGAPMWVVGTAVIVAGGCRPVTPGVAQSLWAWIAEDPEVRRSAYSIHSLQLGIVWVIGPLLVSGMLAVFGPHRGPLVALATAGALTVVGALLVGSVWRRRGPVLPVRHQSADHDHDRPSLYSRPYLTVLACSGLFETGMAAIFVTIGVLAQHFGAPAASGVYVAFWFTGSVIGGTIFCAKPMTRSAARQYRRCLLLYAAGALVCAVVATPWLLGLSLLVAGMAIAPTQAVQSDLVASLAPPRARAEGFTWLQTLAGAGGFAGSAITDPVIRLVQIPVSGFVLAALILAGAAALARPRTVDARGEGCPRP